MSLDQILLGPSPRPFSESSEEVLGLGVSPICPASYSRVGPPRLPTSASIPRGPRPALPAPGPADPTARILAVLVTATGAAAEGGPVRRPSASCWKPEGAHYLLLAPNLRCGTACGLSVACRVCVSACPDGGYRPTQPVPQGNQTGQSPLGSGRCGWGGLLAVLTAILGRGSTVVGGYQDVVLGQRAASLRNSCSCFPMHCTNGLVQEGRR
jgi:hypothetical protein